MKRILWVCAVLLLVSGCGRDRQGQSIPFERVVMNGTETILDADVFYPKPEPAVLVLTPDALATLDAFVPQDQRVVLHRAELEGMLIIAVFQGVIGYIPSGVRIEAIVLNGRELSVHTTFKDASRGKLTMPSGSYSDFDIVAVERAALPSGPEPLLVQVVDQDDTLVVSTTVTLSP